MIVESGKAGIGVEKMVPENYNTTLIVLVLELLRPVQDLILP